MVITKVSYGKTYPLGNYSSERIDLEASIDNIETVEEVLQELRDKCDSIHKTNNPHLYQVPKHDMDDEFNRILEKNGHYISAVEGLNIQLLQEKLVQKYPNEEPQTQEQNNPHLYQEQYTTYPIPSTPFEYDKSKDLKPSDFTEYHNVKAPLQQIIQPSEHFIKDYVAVRNVEIPPQPLTQEQKFLQLISLATSTKELSMYEKTANNHKYPQLKAAYDQKYSQLTEK